MANGVVAGWAYRVAWSLACRLPPDRFWPGLRRVSDRVWKRRGRMVQQLEQNLERAAPGLSEEELRALSREATWSHLRYWGETFRLPRWDAADLDRLVITHAMERVSGTLAEGRGVIAALPHMGNWDLAGAWACAHDMPLTTVVEVLQPESLFHDFLRYREQLGMEPLALSGDYSVLPYLAQRLREGRFVCLLADRDMSRSAVSVPLLGEYARLPVGPAVLAQRTGALLLPVTTDYEGESMHVRVHEPVEVREGDDGIRAMMADVAAVFTEQIRAHPQDWHMTQRIFEADVAASESARD